MKAVSHVFSDSQEDFLRLHFENLIFNPVTYLSNQSEPFEQFW